MHERVDLERTPDPISDPNRDPDRELITADVAQPSGTGDQARQLHAVPAGAAADEAPLLGAEEASGFRSRWDAIQGQFVDDPRHAVEEADHLVAEAIQTLAKGFADERAELEHQWDRGDDISTEDLRVSLQHYRSFFQRLLAA